MLQRLFGRSGKKEAEPGIFTQITHTIRTVLPGAEAFPIRPDTTFEELGFDSIKFINLLLSLEDLVGKDLEEIVADLDLESLRTVGDVADLVTKLKSST